MTGKVPFLLVICLISATAWADEYFVSSAGSDANPGTKAKPFQTIQKAADVMQPGDCCTVQAGVYREWVKPPRGGASEDKRIVYRAAPGEKVVIKGSEAVKNWIRRPDGLWTAEIPDAFFGQFNPYKKNLEGGWIKYGKEVHLGGVYLDGKPYLEKRTREEAAANPETFWIEPRPTSTILHVNFGKADPNAALAEINVRECIFFPLVKGLRYITVDGFTMVHAAANWACFRAFQHALIGAYYGRNWIIQNCRFADARCVALVCGNDPSSENEGFDVQEVGRHIIRNNVFERCGEAGIHGFKGWAGSLIEGNLIQDINTHNEFGGFETGAIKLHDAVDVTIKNNVIRRVTKGSPGDFCGIWLDWGAQGDRITGNVVYDVPGFALFLQNTHGGPILVDNNIIQGRVVTSSASNVYVHNLFVDSTMQCRLEKFSVIYYEPHSAKVAGMLPTSLHHNKYFNNIFIRGAAATIPQAPDYQSDWNVFFETAQKTSWGDEHSLVAPDFATGINFKSLENGVEVTFKSSNAPAQMQTPLITHDFIGKFPLTQQGLETPDGKPLTVNADLTGKSRDARHPAAGPIEELKAENRVRLIVGPRAD